MPTKLLWTLRAVAALILAACSFPAHAAEKRPMWVGIWSGTIGNAAIRVCLTERTYLETPVKGSGAYYYMKYLKPLHLEQEDAKTWVETAGGALQAGDPRWKMERVTGNALSGRWITASRNLPIRLKRLSADSDCGSQTFNQPRFTPFVVRQQAAELDGRKYVKLSSSAGKHLDLSFESFQLADAGAAIGKVNEALREKVPVGHQKANFFECLTGALSSNGYDGDYGEFLQPIMLTRDWLSASYSSGGYCGGAHPFHGSSMLTFDLRSGEKVDLQGWLNERAFGEKSQFQDSPPFSDVLRKFLVAHWPVEREGDAECREAASESNYWDVGLERKGISFTPGMPHVLAACANTVVVPYAEIGPYLNDTGKVGVKSVMANLR